MIQVPINPVFPERFRSALREGQFERLQQGAATARKLLAGRTIWNINSTALGGGVAEMLQPLIAYARGFGIDVRWLVIEGDAEFFIITKRIHNNLHGHQGDGGPLGRAEREHYESIARLNAEEIVEEIRPGDVVICHDPQTAGLVPLLRKRQVYTIWRCHIGNDSQNGLPARAWEFLMPYLLTASHCVFSRSQYVPPQLNHGAATIIAPSIDPLSPKNQPLAPETVRAILVQTGILARPMGDGQARFTREDGSIGYVQRCADIIRLGPAPRFDRPLVVQVSRWDHLKDPIGVMRGFVECVPTEKASLILAGPNVTAVADDPEGGQVLDEVIGVWRRLPHEIRRRIHIACLPMADREENAAIVNALQRHATVVVQKSLYEGFGLTVTEAMWKGRPVVASAVGGIQDQIVDGVHGLLVKNPDDLHGFARAVARLLDNPELAHKMAKNARQRVEDEFLFTRHLMQYLKLLQNLLARPAQGISQMNVA
jgi:trehalose synthase